MTVNGSVTLPRVVLVTGAAGGLGQGLVAEFARQGWHVAAGFHQLSPASESDSVWPIRLDVTDRKMVVSAVDQILSRWKKIDVLINNAGLACDRALPQMQEKDWDRVLAVNLTGAFHCAQAVLGPMMAQQDGHIINISSYAARAGPRGQANYAAAKAALIGLGQALAKEVGRSNVRVNAVLPGVLSTAMTAALDEKATTALATANALGRFNRVAEVARFVAFLATMQDVSGQVFQLDSRIAPW